MFKKEKDLSPCADCYNLCDYELYYRGKRIKDEYTMKSTITVNLNNLTDEERKQLLNLVSKSHTENKSKVWKPNVGDVYYYINSFGTVVQTMYSSQNASNNEHYELGNYFKTKEEAEFALEKQRLITEIKRYIAKNDPEELDWKNYNQPKCYIFYNLVDDFFDKTYDLISRGTDIYFSDKFNWKKMVSDIGGDRIKKYLFEVK